MSGRTIAGFALALALAGCAGLSKEEPPPAPASPFQARASAPQVEGAVAVQRISYSSSDGARVPALMAVPRAAPPRGCLVYQNGIGSSKEESAAVWQGIAGLGLATFSIDFRSHGDRARSSNDPVRALRSSARFTALVRGTVRDLARAVDYLETRRECRGNVGYAGVSLGGMVGAAVAGRDRRVRAVVLMSTPPTWREAIRAFKAIVPRAERRRIRLPAAVPALSPLDPDRWVARIAPRPLMLLLGRRDPLVPAAGRRELAAAAREPKTVVVYDGGHIPFEGGAAPANQRRVAGFLLEHQVKPTYR